MWNHRDDNEPKGFYAKIEPALFPVALALLIVYAFLATPAKAEVDIDPTTVLILHPDQGATVLTQAPILNGSQYMFCVGTREEFPAVQCLRPTTRRGETGSMQEWKGTWEHTVIMVNRRGT